MIQQSTFYFFFAASLGLNLFQNTTLYAKTHLQQLFFTIFICISMPSISEAKLVCDTNIYTLLHSNSAGKKATAKGWNTDRFLFYILIHLFK